MNFFSREISFLFQPSFPIKFQLPVQKNLTQNQFFLIIDFFGILPLQALKPFSFSTFTSPSNNFVESFDSRCIGGGMSGMTIKTEGPGFKSSIFLVNELRFDKL